MKFKKYLMITILPSICLLSCNKENTLVNQNKKIETTTNILEVKYEYTIKGNTSDEFSFYIDENPIDVRYEELYEDYDGSSYMIIEIESKYKEWWNAEMEVAYTRLLELLDEKDIDNLIESQTSWKIYMDNKKYIEESFFFQHKYDSVGELRKALSILEEAEEIKARAYSFLEYIYIITGEINMVFTSE